MTEPCGASSENSPASGSNYWLQVASGNVNYPRRVFARTGSLSNCDLSCIDALCCWLSNQLCCFCLVLLVR